MRIRFMFNVIAGKWAFDGFDDHALVQLTDTLQSSVPALPFNIQSEFHTAVSKIKQLVSANSLTNTAILANYIAPIYARLPRDGSNGGKDATAFAAMSAASTPTRNMPRTPPETPPYETTFYGRQDARLPSRQPPAPQSTKDSRQRQHVPDRTVLTGQDRRRELLTPDRPHGSPRPARADASDADKARIERLQAEISAKQSKLSRMKHHHEQQALMVLPAGYEDPDSDQEQSYALGATEQRPEPSCVLQLRV
jgi:hypothetical protein